MKEPLLDEPKKREREKCDVNVRLSDQRPHELEKAQDLVREAKPLRDIPWSQMFPFLFCNCGKKKESECVIEEEHYHDEEDEHELHTEKLKKNPYLVFGLGMRGYLNLI